MRIDRVDTYGNEWVAFVRVRTDDGAEGWGQVAPYNADITAEVLHRQVAPHVLGTDPLDPEAVGPACSTPSTSSQAHTSAGRWPGVDTALWDLRGRLEGVGVSELLGGRRAGPIHAYASSMRRDIAPATRRGGSPSCETATASPRSRSASARSAGTTRTSGPAGPRRSFRLCAAAVGLDARLLVDANSCYTPAKAIEVGRFLEQHGVIHLEEPCPYWELEWTAEVAEALDLDVAGGEQDCLLSSWRRMIDLRAVDIVQPDVCYVGGLTRALAVAGWRPMPACRARRTRPTCRS